MTRNARRWLSGRTLVALSVVDPTLLSAASAAVLAGAELGEARRRGKYLCQPVGGQVLILHFRMTGKIVLESTPRRHARIRLHTAEGCVAFIDTRRLGRAWIVPESGLSAFFQAIPLGDEPWPDRRDGAWWAERLAGLRGPVKPAMMRQERIAGLGNIAAAEICHRARIHPARPVAALTAADFDALAAATPAFIEQVLAAESGPEIHFVSEGAPTPAPFLVYGRQGADCTCGGTVSRISQSGRTTFFCPSCQRL
jgi:formamidopyrimidine-DNA glycosylase